MAEPKSDLRLEIAHVLFIDIVGYSKRLIDEQHELLQDLNQIVRSTEAFRQRGDLRQIDSSSDWNVLRLTKLSGFHGRTKI